MSIGTWLLVPVAAFALLMLFTICRSFYIACIYGFDPAPAASPCESVEARNVPGKIWDAIEPTRDPIAATGATPLGFLKLHTGPIHQFSSVWWAENGAIVIYGSASLVPVPGGEIRATASHITCSSSLSNGTQVQTVNQNAVPSNDTDGFHVRAFPTWMPAAALLEIHQARLSRESLPVRPVEPSLDRIVTLNNQCVLAMREDIERIMGNRPGPDGRQRVSPWAWTKEVVKFLPPVGTILRSTRRARLRRELKDLDLLHLWKKPPDSSPRSPR